MVGMSFGGLFDQKNQYADDGSLITAGTQEYAGKYQTQAFAVKTLNGALSTTLYTVPAGKVFYLAQYCASFGEGTTASDLFTLLLGATGIINFILPPAPAVGTYVYGQVAHSLTMPIRCTAGQVLSMTQTQLANFFVMSISGWLEDA